MMESFDINNYFVVYKNDSYEFYLLSKDKKKVFLDKRNLSLSLIEINGCTYIHQSYL